ncbi:MAG TPA: bifunctional nuclease family protein [Gemmatimonadaceae bacterium]|nr:bifunctional nuclease family protein [Gemmatimonadaceae bacterium]
MLMVEVVVARLGLDSSTNSFVVILQERGGERLLPIWIGRPEAEAIAAHLQSVKRERPLTHDLAKSLIVGLGADVRRISITKVEDRTYYAELQLAKGTELISIDARPSDSIAIALRCGAPIFAADDLLMAPSDDDAEGEGDPAESPTPPKPGDELSAEALQRHLATLRPEDFGKFRP